MTVPLQLQHAPPIKMVAVYCRREARMGHPALRVYGRHSHAATAAAQHEKMTRENSSSCICQKRYPQTTQNVLCRHLIQRLSRAPEPEGQTMRSRRLAVTSRWQSGKLFYILVFEIARLAHITQPFSLRDTCQPWDALLYGCVQF